MNHIRFNWLMFLVITTISFHIIRPSATLAQSDKNRYMKQQRYVEENIRLALDKNLPASQKVLFDWGGWVSSHLYLFDDGEESSRTLRQNELRLWGSLNIENGIHQGYARMRMTYNDYNDGDSYDGNDDDLEGPNLERGWYRLDISKALAKYNNINLPVSFAVKVGRDYTMFGTGLALSIPLDAVWIESTIGDFEIEGLLGRTIHSYDNIDDSRPHYWQSWRYFYGIQVKYNGIENHQPFFYYLWQRDRQDDGNPIWMLQQWRYDSEYLGFGSVGQVSPYVRYSTEWVLERGKGYGDGQFFNRNKVSAYAWDFQIEYLPNWKTSPTFTFEYIFASGDTTRIFSPTNAMGGNYPFTKDSSFNGFGYRNTGLVLFPDITNIHIWRLGASFFPFERSKKEWLKKMELGTDWFLYHKHHRSAAISDPLANVQSGYVGWEMDYFMNWRLTSDLAWTIRYGAFFPGKAFSDRTTRTFLLTGITWNF